MADGFGEQPKQIENTAVEIVQAARKLRDDRAAAGEINQRLRRFLERKKQA